MDDGYSLIPGEHPEPGPYERSRRGDDSKCEPYCRIIHKRGRASTGSHKRKNAQAAVKRRPRYRREESRNHEEENRIDNDAHCPRHRRTNGPEIGCQPPQDCGVGEEFHKMQLRRQIGPPMRLYVCKWNMCNGVYQYSDAKYLRYDGTV